jgi:hypothetical protein
LSTLVFMIAALGVSAVVRLWLRTSTVYREAVILAPVAALFLWYLGVTTHLHENLSSWDYKTPPALRRVLGAKIRSLSLEFISFERGLIAPTLILFGACLLLPAWRELRAAALRRPAVIEQLALVAAFLAIYCVLPSQYEDASYVDARALPVVTLLLLLASLRVPSDASVGATFARPWVLALAMLLAVTHLVYVMLPLSSNNAWISRYRAVEASIPPGSYVLPVHTETKQQHLLHVGSHVVLDRGAIIPYLFSRDNGAPMTYFSYKHFPYTPDQQWYRTRLHGGNEAGAVDWSRVGCEYDFILVSIPFDARLIRVPTTTVAHNEAAALLAVDKRSCDSASR